MKTFNFSLQRVLDLRIHERKQAERALAEIQQQRRTLEERLRRLRQGFEQSMQIPRPGDAELADLRRMAAHRQNVRKKQQGLLDELEDVQAKEQQARRRLVDKRRAEETLQSLYEDEHDEHVKTQKRINQQLLDEQAITQHLQQNPLQS